jgi:hypothetical protein
LLAVPIKNGVETTFFVSKETSTIDIVTPDGSTIKPNAAILGSVSQDYALARIADISEVGPGACFRLQANINEMTFNVEIDGASIEQTASGDIGTYNRIEIRSINTQIGGKQTIIIKGFKLYRLTSGMRPYDVACSVYIKSQNTGEVLASCYVNGLQDVEMEFEIAQGDRAIIYLEYQITEESKDQTIYLTYDSIVYTDQKNTAMYSNLLKRVHEDSQFAVVNYKCEEEAFGFPFDRENFIQQLMPINIHSPQFKQSDKIYEKLNGEQVVLYATISREYDGETDYLPEDWHTKIISALSCDKVYINGEKVTKSGNYEIDWEKYDTLCGGAKAAKATFKVSDNIMQRNSNY